MTWLDGLFLGGMLVSLPLAVAVVFRPLPNHTRWPSVALIGGWIALACVVALGPTAVDFTIFWKAGGDVRGGVDPYHASVAENRPFFNPPSALPLFAGFACLPLPVAFAIWEGFNIAGGLALVHLARWAVRETRTAPDVVNLNDTLALTAAIGFSNAFRSNLLLGQMAVLAAVALVVAVCCWRRGWWWGAAAALAVATVKVGTALPFLFLLHRRRDWIVWPLGGLLTFGLCVLGGPVEELPDRCRRLIENIGVYSSPGYINDYSDAGPHSADIIGYDKLLYHIGVTDRATNRIGQFVLLGLILVALGIDVFFLRRIPEWAVGPLLGTVGLLFLYHRNYDTVLLFLPLVAAVAHARVSVGKPRWLSRAAAVALLLVVFMPRKLLFELTHHPTILEPGLWPVRVLVLPVSTWLITLALGLLWAAVRGRAPTPAASVAAQSESQ